MKTMKELEAICPICGKVSKTTGNRRGWESGCSHAERRSISGHGPLPPAETDTITFSFVVRHQYDVEAS